MMAKYKGYKVELTGFSLGASLALHMADVFKVPYVAFNAGVGADYKKLGKEMGQNEGKYYHTEGDAVSALGLGQFKDTIMIRNKTGNMASAHSRNSYTKYSYDKDQQQKSIEDEAREAQLKATPAQTPPVEPTKLTIPPPPSQNVQVDTATEPVFDRRDLDTLTDEWGGSIFDDIKKILPSTKSNIENIATIKTYTIGTWHQLCRIFTYYKDIRQKKGITTKQMLYKRRLPNLVLKPNT